MAAKNKPRRNAPKTPPPTPEPSLERRVEAVVGPGGACRADRYVAETLGCLTRSQIKARNAKVEIEGRPSKLSRPLVEGERIVVSWTEEASPSLEAETIPLDILYEDERVIVVNKAQGMVTHPGAGNRRGTLANAILGHLSTLPGSTKPAAPLRGGIVHRLDKDTSGAIIIAKDAETQAYLAAQFKDRTTRKEYLAITTGIPAAPPDRGARVAWHPANDAAKDRFGAAIGEANSGPHAGWHHIESRLGRDSRDRKRFAELDSGGKLAVTEWRVVATYGNFAFIHLRPRTGRTHQLRVHLASLGCPIVGDPIYGGKRSSAPESGNGPSPRGGSGPHGSPDPHAGPSLMLHAWKLAIRLPGSAEHSQFIAPIPARFVSLLRNLEARHGKKKPPRS